MRDYLKTTIFISFIILLFVIGCISVVNISKVYKSEDAGVKHVDVSGGYELELCVDEVGQKYYKGSDGAKFDIENKMALDSTQPKQEPETIRWVLNNQTGEYDLAT